tara:strand:- start:623 stop:1099 length:477 start_codon:yes stop_codon:yes gene_type:complete
MKQIITASILSLFLMTLAGCGFKVINESEENNFSIKEITVSGDKRINFKIKNNLLNYSKKNSRNKLYINLSSRKNKSIKEKNIKNEVTKYQISLYINVSFKKDNNDKNYLINLIHEGEYLVANSYSTTLNNEKKLIDDLIEHSSERILKKISLKLDDI